jgi:CRP/FNR family transcriptional regulator
MTIDAGTEESLVAAYSALRHLPEGRLAEIRSRGLTAAVTAGTTVFEPNDFCRQFPFPIQGTARVLKVGSLGRDTLLYRLRPGDYCLLSSVALLARWRFAARVVAESDLKAVVIPATLFRTLVSESREFSGSVHLAIARRLEVVLDLVEQATFFRLDQRVATLLLTSGPSLAASHQDLANDLGASRENISRVLEGFRDRGWIALGRRQIEVIDPSALEAFLDQGAPS